MELIFGSQVHLTVLQECARAVLVFCYGLIMLRLSGRRTFGRWSAVDFVISVVVGSALSRVMTASAPMPGTLAAVALLVLLHVAVSHGVARSKAFSRLVEGSAVVLGEDGKLDDLQRRRFMVSECDLAEALRRHGLSGLDALDQTRQITLEPNGKISIVRKG